MGAQWFLENGGRDAIGRQRQIRDHGRRAAVRRRPVPLSRQPADGQREGRARRQAELRLAARRQAELPGEVPGHRHRIRHRPRCPAQPRHRLPRHRQLLPGHQGDPGAAEDPLPRRPCAGSAAAYPGAPPTAHRYGPTDAALPAAARRTAAGSPTPLPGDNHEENRPRTRRGWCCSPRCAWSSCSLS